VAFQSLLKGGGPILPSPSEGSKIREIKNLRPKNFAFLGPLPPPFFFEKGWNLIEQVIILIIIVNIISIIIIG